MVAKNSSVLALLTVAVCSQVGSTAASENCTRNYTVQPGDSCNNISMNHNVSTYALFTLNNDTIDTACDDLSPGQLLCLGNANQNCTQVHVIQAGESCDTIAAMANITVPELFAHNPNINTNCTNIIQGEVLCVAP